ncbi:MAG TPA: thioredoxin domain-containing protein [Pyrinomonadaceae bacterium]|nr:thioredoxin domain-containing protein [Pyrinomonadaceae bacterium]
MSFNKFLVAAALLCLLVLSIAAQQRRGRAQRPPAPQRPAQSATPAASPSSPVTTAATPAPAIDPQTVVLAVLNNQKITLADIDEESRSLALSLEQDIMDARRFQLETQVNRILFETEARRRHVTVEQLLDAEVNDRVIGPTEDEIRAAYEENRAQIGSNDYVSMRSSLINYIRAQRAQKLTRDFADRLKATTPVTLGADPNAQNLAPGTQLATVAGHTITAAEFNERVNGVIYELRMKAFDAERNALDALINNALISAEAERRNIPSNEVMRQEITNKLTEPTDADIRKFYEENRSRLTGDFESYRTDIATFLQQQQQDRLEHELAQRLRAAAGQNLRIMLTEPEAPVQNIAVDGDPARGDANAAVTVVEFTDFQCPACGRTYPILEQALKPYGSRVRLVIRDFPLDQHENARKAAEAADAAAAQGKFFEYIDILFNHQSALDVASLKKYASQLGLDRAKFDAALDGGTYAAEVQHDVDDGLSYGIFSTPTIFVNGQRLHDASTVELIRAAIDRALARTRRQ